MTPNRGHVLSFGDRMKNNSNAHENPPAGSVSLRGLAALFPYRAANRARSQREYQILSNAQTADEISRRNDFHERLAAFKESGESLRSNPTYLPDPLLGRTDLVQQDHLQNYFANQAGSSSIRSSGAPQAHMVAPIQPKAASVDQEPDPFPFDVPPMDCDAFADVPVDVEYDQRVGTEVDGPDGQPDVHDWSKGTTGTITKIGFFPFRYKRGENKTHMVRIGTKDHWGADLERVIREFKLKEGDNISLVCIGKQPVVVKQKVDNGDGTYRMEDVDALRNTWACKRV
jgi:hypothetical protein